jgi:hypothetical protein
MVRDVDEPRDLGLRTVGIVFEAACPTTLGPSSEQAIVQQRTPAAVPQVEARLLAWS